MTTATEEWLNQNTFYCYRLRARISREQCRKNQNAGVKSCFGCPGLGEPEQRNPGPGERKCQLCGRIKPLEGFRPHLTDLHLDDPRRVKTCLACEQRYNLLPKSYREYVQKEAGDNVEGSSNAEQEKENQKGELMKEEDPIAQSETSPTEDDPLASAIHLQPLQQYTTSETPVARLNKQGRDLYFSSLSCQEFKILDYTHCDFYLADDDQTPLIHLHDSPGRNSRKLAVDNKKSNSAAHISCIAFAKMLGWEPGQEWLVQGTARADVIKLVAAEQ